eukprot:gene8068-4281_t
MVSGKCDQHAAELAGLRQVSSVQRAELELQRDASAKQSEECSSLQAEVGRLQSAAEDRECVEKDNRIAELLETNEQFMASEAALRQELLAVRRRVAHIPQQEMRTLRNQATLKRAFICAQE